MSFCPTLVQVSRQVSLGEPSPCSARLRGAELRHGQQGLDSRCGETFAVGLAEPSELIGVVEFVGVVG